MTNKKFVVVGAGPVGALAAIYAAQRGHDVEVYELRGDLRDAQTVPLNFTKSINLALSERGINAMRHSGRPDLLKSILAETIPMHGRMIHGEQFGSLFEESQQYDIHGRYISAADRGMLNKRLLDELETFPNVKFFFNHKLTGADFKANKAWFEQRSTGSSTVRAKEIEISFDVMLGCDGAHSAVRYHLMKFSRMNYSQSYIDTLWCEFHMTPSKDNDFRISPHHLHIWPGKQFMFIAIPSTDKSFTCTLFLPAGHFSDLDSHPEKLIPFFDKNFPGIARNLISEDDLQKQYKTNPHLPLISIKCDPHHYGSSAVILGDAAHAMVPFYGQGMNAGLEDVRVLFETLDAHHAPYTNGHAKAPVPTDAPSTSTSPSSGASTSIQPTPPSDSVDRTLASALEAYSRIRTPQAAAICDLALQNYQEMRADVQSPLYLLRKKVEESLSKWLPSLGWATQYSRVSFENVPYDEVIQRAQRQGRLLTWWFGAALGGLSVGALFGGRVAWQYMKMRRLS
ncbi:Kynurenine 3-monooxygenase [Sphaceloma murrayae]|uniref:Kynurenine 3-monooxygenase n=1 Tax=Sphaceloma murrayae TaxID=2082308 RepID=A0A2K1R3U1_9PEZI|nr:Kynurenine 3-monooxygenase [Sphaceloma murrayae]